MSIKPIFSRLIFPFRWIRGKLDRPIYVVTWVVRVWIPYQFKRWVSWRWIRRWIIPVIIFKIWQTLYELVIFIFLIGDVEGRKAIHQQVIEIRDK